MARGLKFALAGGTMMAGKETAHQQQLLFVAEDRIVSVQFTATAKDTPVCRRRGTDLRKLPDPGNAKEPGRADLARALARV